ncbi:unnamed protein product [Pedinophyceae sp. YPF-701]|nr:unnamed protein product [Pedinophyceae sp. YPF-701]
MGLHVRISLGAPGPLDVGVQATGRETMLAGDSLRHAEEEVYEVRRRARRAQRKAEGHEDDLFAADVSLSQVVARSLTFLAMFLVLTNKRRVLASEGLSAAAAAFPFGLVFARIVNKIRARKHERNLAMTTDPFHLTRHMPEELAEAWLRKLGVRVPRRHQGVERPPPDTTWLNRALAGLWPFYDEAVCGGNGILRKQVEPILEQFLPMGIKRIYFRKIKLGDKPPQIMAAGYVPVGEDEDPALDLEISWISSAEVLMCAEIGKSGYREVTASITNVAIRAKVRVCFRCVTDRIPCFSAVVVTLMETPVVDYQLNLNISRGPLERMLTRFLDRLLTEILVRMMVWPQRLVFPLNNSFGSLSHLHPRWTGVLRVRVLSGTGLPKAKRVSKGAYVELSLDPFRVQKTGTAKRSQDPRWDEEDIWLRIIELSCSLRIEVWDKAFSFVELSFRDRLSFKESTELDDRNLVGRSLIDLSGLEHNKPVLATAVLSKKSWHETEKDGGLCVEPKLGSVQLELLYLKIDELRKVRPAMRKATLDPDNASLEDRAIAAAVTKTTVRPEEKLKQKKKGGAKASKWQTGMLGIKAMEGRALGVRTDGKERVHVKFAVGSERATSPPAEAKPVVNFNYFTAFLGTSADEDLVVEVYNDAELLGTAEVQIAELARLSGDKIHDVIPFAGTMATGDAYAGRLQLEMEWLPVTTKSVPEVTRPALSRFYQGGDLRVHVVSADLQTQQRRGSAVHPFAKLRIGTIEQYTFDEMKTTKPAWNKVFEFKNVEAGAEVEFVVYSGKGPVTTRDATADALTMQRPSALLREPRRGQEREKVPMKTMNRGRVDETLGSCRILIREVLVQPGYELCNRKFALTRCNGTIRTGEVRLDLRFFPNPFREGRDGLTQAPQVAVGSGADMSGFNLKKILLQFFWIDLVTWWWTKRQRNERLAPRHSKTARGYADGNDSGGVSAMFLLVVFVCQICVVFIALGAWHALDDDDNCSA